METGPPRVIGDFKIRRELGRGGMGVVYLARQLSLVRDVALKVLNPGGLEQDSVLRFQREASLLGRLSHPNIVQVFLVGQHGSLHYLAMEYVEGTDLEQVLRARHEGPPAAGADAADTPSAATTDFHRDPVGAALRIARDVASALAAAHASGIVHRDVKPSNILLARDGRARLADFGLARELRGAALTSSGETLGTPFYMSPERYGAAEPSPASDVYAVGAVLYECVCRRRPFDADSAQALMARILHDEPERPRRIDPSLPRDLETLILKCLEKEPARRYPDGAELLADLERLIAGEPIAATEASAMTRALRRARRRKVPALAAWSVALVALGLLAWGIWSWRSSRQKDVEHQQSEATAEEERARRELQFAIAQALDREDLPSARGLLEQGLSRWPDDEPMRFERAELALRDMPRRFGDAAADYEVLAAGALDPDAARMGLRITSAALDPRRAAPELDDLPAPSTGRQAWYRSILHQQRRERDLALEWNERAVEIDPAILEAWYSLGASRYRIRDYAGADEALEYYCARRRRAEAEQFLGHIAWMNGRYETALTCYERVSERRPDDYAAWTNVAAARVGLATKAAEVDDDVAFHANVEVARDALGRARELSPSFCMIFFNEAMLRLLEGDPADAERLLFEALAGDFATPERRHEMWIWYGRTLEWRGWHDDAIDHLQAGAAEDPSLASNEFFVFALADALIGAGRPDEAASYLDAALSGAFAGNAALLALRERLRES